METAAMAAPGLESSRTAQGEEPSGSTESSDAVRTPVPIASTVSPELPVSPGQGVEPPGKSLWEQICEGRQPGSAERGGTRQAGAAFTGRLLCSRCLTCVPSLVAAPQARRHLHFTDRETEAPRFCPRLLSAVSHLDS